MNRPGEKPMGLAADPIYGDALAGSYDGLGATYGNRIRLKAKTGRPLSHGERAWLGRDRALKSRHVKSRKMARIGGRHFTPGLSDFSEFDGDGLEGKASKKFFKNVKKIGRYAAASAVLAPAAIFGGKKGAVAVGKIAGSKKFEKVAKASITPLRILAATVATAGIATAIGGAGGAAGAATKAASGGSKLLSFATKVKAARDKISAARKNLGLPPLTLARQKQVDAQVEQQINAGASPEEAATTTGPLVGGDTVTPSGPAGGGTGRASSDYGSYGPPPPEPATGGTAPEADRTATSSASSPAEGGGKSKGLLIAGAAAVALLLFMRKKR
jgi:hypothetical protein